ncbi:MAG: acetate--CoA ligase family protein [Candidatus Heimdallarchaeaceae archaeon]
MSKIKEIFEIVRKENRTALLEHESKDILMEIGIQVPPSKLISSKEEAISFARELGYPLVMKVMSPQILHKTDAGAVMIGINSEEEILSTYENFTKKFMNYNVKGILVEKMVKQGLELIIGTNTDPTFGPVVLFGVGGILVEAIRDVVFRLCPTTVEQALEALDEIKAKTLLEGFRGMQPINKQQLAEMIVKISQLAWEYKDYISEMDINPIIANEDGLFPVDARIILKEKNNGSL